MSENPDFKIIKYSEIKGGLAKTNPQLYGWLSKIADVDSLPVIKARYYYADHILLKGVFYVRDRG